MKSPDPTPAERILADCQTCGGKGEIEVERGRDRFGNWDYDSYDCPDCAATSEQEN